MIPTGPNDGDLDSSDEDGQARVERILHTLGLMRNVRMAEGIVMATCDVSRADATEILFDRARAEDVSISDVAQAVIDTGLI